MSRRSEISEEKILELFRREASRPLSLREVQAALNLSAGERREVGQLIKSMARQKRLRKVHGGRFSLPDGGRQVSGVLSVHRDGYGFVAGEQGRDDIFVPRRFLRPAMNGDRVVVSMERDPRTGRPEGHIVSIAERRHTSLIGQYNRVHGGGYVTPVDPALHEDIIVIAGGDGGAAPGQMVVLKVESYPGRNSAATGRVTDVLGDADDPAVEIRVAAETFELPFTFSADALAEAGRVPLHVTEKDLVGREDLRDLPFVTIDGETAKDFDDAVAIEKVASGGFRLWVAIADVAHYVRPGSAIDRDALERGNSVYFPGDCIPMLPEVLSNGICSLVPGEDRLAQVAELVFNSQGQRTDARFYDAVICSRSRLTYSEVKTVLAGEEKETCSHCVEHLDDLQCMAELAELRMARRRDRGSLDFDLPTAEILLDLRGRPENVIRSERTLAHRMIEEMMLAANEAVAGWLEQQRVPLIYRVHDRPGEEKMALFQDFLAHFNQGIAIPEAGVTPSLLQELLVRVAGRPEERVINHVLLRSLPQAVYSVNNIGHFGLAAERYCHFTSPIRRYPDLVVHRIMKRQRGAVTGKPLKADLTLEEAAVRATACERRAMEAERDIVDLKKCQFMEQKIGEVFRGMVTSVQAFGFFVELEEFFVEGLVHVNSLEDDFYQYEEGLQRLIGMRQRRSFEIGDLVNVKLQQVDIARREITFHLQGGGVSNGLKRARRGGERRRRTR